MNYRKLGNSDIEVTELTFGCMSIVNDINSNSQSEKDSIDAIDVSLSEGINFFDTAPGYGNGASEVLLGKALGSRRKDVIVATKVSGSLKKEDVFRACEKSLKRLNTDYVDLYQIHWPDWETPLAETIDAFDRLKTEGKIRWYGVSNFGKEDLTEALESGNVVTNQMAYNLIWRNIEKELIPICEKENVGILCYSSMMQGLLTGKFKTVEEVPEGRARSRHFSKNNRPLAVHQEEGFEKETFEAIDALRSISESHHLPMGTLALKWLLAQPAVTSVLVGARNAQQAKENIDAVRSDVLPEALSDATEATEPLKSLMGLNLDMWAKGSRIR
ncbi:MAG: aldo/keto reductase [Nitrospirota bacterium]|nr:aldo/keto reductase [Nitrospirota bacterium]